jgi:hypothetical protein
LRGAWRWRGYQGLELAAPGSSRDEFQVRPLAFSPRSAEGREPDSSVGRVLACYEVLDELTKQLRG